MTAIWETCLYQAGTLNVLLAMADCASGHDGSGIFPGNDYLAAKCRQSVRATLDAIKRLRADGTIKQLDEDGDDLPPDVNSPGGRGRKAEYRIDLERVQELQSLHEVENADCEICKQHRLSAEKKLRRRAAKGAVSVGKGGVIVGKGEVFRSRIEEEPSKPSNELPSRIASGDDARGLEARVARLIQRLGAEKYRAWFTGVSFEVGPPTTIVAPRVSCANWIRSNYLSLLEQVFDGDVKVVVVGDRGADATAVRSALAPSNVQPQAGPTPWWNADGSDGGAANAGESHAKN